MHKEFSKSKSWSSKRNVLFDLVFRESHSRGCDWKILAANRGQLRVKTKDLKSLNIILLLKTKRMQEKQKNLEENQLKITYEYLLKCPA